MRGTPSVSVNTPVGAFGGAVAQAVEHLGADVSHAGNELFQRAMALQQLRNETEAREADAKYMQEAGILHANYNALEGKAAVDAFKPHLKELDTLRQNIRGTLGTDVARKMYDSPSLNTMGRTIFNAANHSATQNKRWAVGTIEAQQNQAIKGVYDYPNDQQGYDRVISNIEVGAENMKAIHGWSNPQRDAYTKEKVSAALSNRILGLAKSEPLKANDLYEANKTSLWGQDALRVETGVHNQMRTMYSRNISNTVLADLKEDPTELRKSIPLQDRIDQGLAIAEKEASNVPGIQDAVRERIQSDWQRVKRINNDDNRASLDTVGSALLGQTGEKGVLPTTMEELQADPKVAEALDKLRPTQLKTVQKALANNSKGEVIETPERRDRYYKLLGMATDRPAEFLDMDVTKEDIPIKYRTELFKKQQSILKGAQEDPRLTRAMQTMQPDLESIGYGMGKNREAYYKFKGQFQLAMEDYISENKKAPNAEEVRKIGARLLRKTTREPTDFYGRPRQKDIFDTIFSGKQKFFEQDVPQNDIDEIKAKISADRPGFEPTDDQIRREIIRKRYNDVYKGAPKKATEGGPSVPISK